MNEKKIPNRKVNRLPKYDYSQSGWYFVTICTNHMKQWFGEVKNRKIILNECGKIVWNYWKQISKHYTSDYTSVDIDEFIVMPNHVHGIVVIHNVGAKFISPNHTGDLKIAPTNNVKTNNITLSLIIKYFKSITCINVRNFNRYFKWQRSFYDHIIRNEKSLYAIRQYIKFNAYKWDDDEYNL